MLLTVCAPEECVTVMSPGRSITTSSFVPGTVPVLQFDPVFQSPLEAIQLFVAAFILSDPRTNRKSINGHTKCRPTLLKGCSIECRDLSISRVKPDRFDPQGRNTWSCGAIFRKS